MRPPATSSPAKTAQSTYIAERYHGSRWKSKRLEKVLLPIKLYRMALANAISTAAAIKKMRSAALSLPPIRLYVLYLRLDPVFYSVGVDRFAQRFRPMLTFFFWHGKRSVDGIGLFVDVVGVDGQCIFA